MSLLHQALTRLTGHYCSNLDALHRRAPHFEAVDKLLDQLAAEHIDARGGFDGNTHLILIKTTEPANLLRHAEAHGWKATADNSHSYQIFKPARDTDFWPVHIRSEA